VRKNNPTLKLKSLHKKLKKLSWGKRFEVVLSHLKLFTDFISSEDGKPLSKKALKKLEKEREKAARRAETAARIAQEQAANDGPVSYGLEQTLLEYKDHCVLTTRTRISLKESTASCL
jgi:hypothetical protein